MTQDSFVKKRSASWEQIEKRLSLPSKEFKQDIQSFPSEYRRICQDLNACRAENFDPLLIDRLNRLVLACHQKLYGTRRLSLAPIFHFWSKDFPRAVRTLWLPVLIGHLLFYGTGLLLFLWIWIAPDMVYEVLPEGLIVNMEEMYDPTDERFLTPRGVSGDADMFGYYIYNNISVAFQTFAGGILAGIGSLLFLVYNGIIFGTLSAHMLNIGYSSTFFTFVVGHSSFELTAIIFSAVAGLIMGWTLVVPGLQDRKRALQKAGKKVLPLLYGSILFLIFAAVIEAFWSSQHTLPSAVKYSVGGLLWVLVLLYFLLAGRADESK